MPENRQKKQQGLGQLWQSVQQRFASGQAKITAGVEKKDQERLEDYLAESGQLTGAKAARRRLQNSNAFSALEKDYRLKQADFKQAAYNKAGKVNAYDSQYQESQLLDTNKRTERVKSFNAATYANAAPSQSNRATAAYRNAAAQSAMTGSAQAVNSAQAKRDKSFSFAKSFFANLSKRQLRSKKKENTKFNSLLQSDNDVNASETVRADQVSGSASAKAEALLQKQEKKQSLTNRIKNIFTTMFAAKGADKSIQTGKQLNASELAKISKDLDQTILKMQKQERRRRIVTVTCFCLSLLLVAVLLGNIILKQTMAKPELYMISSGSLEQAFDCFGFVTREEKVLYSPAEGELQAIAAEGSLVASGQEVANIVVSDVSDLKTRMDTIDQQIAEQLLTVLKRGGNLQANQIFTKTDTDMLPTVQLMRKDATLNDLSQMENYIYTLQPLMQERNFALNQINLHDPVIENLQSEQKLLNHSLKEKAQIIQTPSAGSISYKINPFGVDINTETIQSMSYEQFITYYNSAKPSVSTIGTVKLQVPIIRLIDTQYQYFLLQVTNAKSSDFQEGSSYRLKLNSQSQAIDNCVVLRVTPDAGGVLILLRSDRKVQNLIDQVAVKGQLLKQTTSGLKVPKSALLYDDKNRESTAYLLVIKSGFVEKTGVRVLEANEQFAIVDSLVGNDITDNSVIVVNPRQVKEGQQVT